MGKLTIIDAETIATINSINERLILLNNKMAENGIEDTSLWFEWSPTSVDIHAFHWEVNKPKQLESYTWYYDLKINGHTLEGLYKTLEEWEEKYGLIEGERT